MSNSLLRCCLLALAGAALLGLTACSETDNDDNEYANWRQRNERFFATAMQTCRDSMAYYHRAYGEAWQEHTTWAAFLNYSEDADTLHTLSDSICVQIVRRGDATAARPFSTDSVRIRYRALLMPTEQHPEGFVADHSGTFASFARVFDETTAAPTTFKCSALVRGVTTALLHMHPGDLWRIYVPQGLAYGSTASSTVPAYSTLVFECQLVDTWRIGTVPTPWR